MSRPDADADITEAMLDRAEAAVVLAREDEMRAYIAGDVPANQWRPRVYAEAAIRAALAPDGAADQRDVDKHSVQHDVEDFHWDVIGVPAFDTPEVRRPELRASLIIEEAAETACAILRGDLVEAIDGMCDILAVVYGTAAEFGINLAPFWDEVHRTNMAKVGGAVRADGKHLKPAGWTPPDIAGILDAAEPDALTQLTEWREMFG